MRLEIGGVNSVRQAGGNQTIQSRARSWILNLELSAIRSSARATSNKLHGAWCEKWRHGKSATGQFLPLLASPPYESFGFVVDGRLFGPNEQLIGPLKQLRQVT